MFAADSIIGYNQIFMSNQLWAKSNAPEFQTSPVGQCIKNNIGMMKRHDFPIFIKLKSIGNHKVGLSMATSTVLYKCTSEIQLKKCAKGVTSLVLVLLA